MTELAIALVTGTRVGGIISFAIVALASFVMVRWLRSTYPTLTGGLARWLSGF